MQIRILIILFFSVLITIAVSELLPASLPLFLPHGSRPGMAAGANDRMTYIAIKEAVEQIHEGRGILVDVRDREKFQEDHPAGAVNIPYHEQESIYAGINEIIPEGKTVYILCYGALCDMSARVAEKMDELGYKCIIVRNGFEGWKKLNLPTEQKTP